VVSDNCLQWHFVILYTLHAIWLMWNKQKTSYLLCFIVNITHRHIIQFSLKRELHRRRSCWMQLSDAACRDVGGRPIPFCLLIACYTVRLTYCNIICTCLIVTVYTCLQADNFWLKFDIESLEVDLYVGHATQPYFNSQSHHGMDH